MSYPPYSGSTSQQFNDAPIKASNNGVNQLAYQRSLINSTPGAAANVTGVTLNFTGLTIAQITKPGSKVLAFTAVGTLLSWDGGAGVNVGAGGTFTLTGADGRQVKAVVVALSLPVGNQSDNIVVSSPIGQDDKRIVYAEGKFNQKMQSAPYVDIAGTHAASFDTANMDVNTNLITKQPVNTTGVVLSLDGIALASQLVPGSHSLAFTAAGTLLAVDGGAGVNVGAGGTFTLTAPNGTTVKAIVTSANLPVGNTADAALTVTAFPAQALVKEDTSLRASLSAVYNAL